MKLTVTQENLNKALLIVSKIAGSKTPLPILNNILLKTENNRLLLAATNLEIAITVFIGTKIDKKGSLTIPAKLITEFVNNLPKDNIDIENKGSHIDIKSGMYKSTINGLSSDEFPSLPIISEKNSTSITLPTILLKKAIIQTSVAASHDTTRPMLTGAYLHTFNGSLYIATTDGYRLAERKITDIKTKKAIDTIIPISSLQEVVRVIPDDQNDIEILIDENQIRFRVNDIEITSKLIDATFVDYRQLIPNTQDIKIIIDKSEFTRIVKVASLFARESAGGITIKTDSSNNTISIHSIASQLGENTSSANAEIEGDGSITLNSKYLLEALGCIDGEKVEFSFNGKLSPSVLTDADEVESVYQHIIMPLKS